MAIFDKNIEKEFQKRIAEEKSFDTVEEAKEYIMKHYYNILAPTVWKGMGKYFVIPIEKAVEAERLDFEQVIDTKGIIIMYHKRKNNVAR